jgi:glyoxylase-like metal-dependent hydrolase (beta-lactamase superfamily II)
MRIHAIQTGSVRIKTAQVRGRGTGLRRRLALFTDPDWTEWLPTYAFVIDHPDGIIVVDTGQGTHALSSTRSLHPYQRWHVRFRIRPQEEIGPQLQAMGIGPRDVKHVILTHLHMDHDGGLAHFPHSHIFVTRGELSAASGWVGRLSGYLPHRWPAWFDPIPLDLGSESFGTFTASRRMTAAGDVIVVATPGHTEDHVSVIVVDEGICYALSGDASYTEAAMLAGEVDGVSGDDVSALATLDAFRRMAAERPTVYLPAHDPESATRLANRRFTEITVDVSRF